jgi:hypothetical protein
MMMPGVQNVRLAFFLEGNKKQGCPKGHPLKMDH